MNESNLKGPFNEEGNMQEMGTFCCLFTFLSEHVCLQVNHCFTVLYVFFKLSEQNDSTFIYSEINIVKISQQYYYSYGVLKMLLHRY